MESCSSLVSSREELILLMSAIFAGADVIFCLFLAGLDEAEGGIVY